ncbi:MAG: erythromycin esterase family protein [Bacteroidales bacterium]|jgi:erythromycin esterase-like protein|nr:erythromycin esterase family protein [Bacteroidales bacterium]
MTSTNKIIALILIVLLTGLWTKGYSQTVNYTEKYCLNFLTPKLNFDGWEISALNMSFEQRRKNSTYIDTDALMISSGVSSIDQYRDRLSCTIYTKERLLLPENSSTLKAEIVLTCKSENLKKIDLIIDGYDKNEQKLRSDTLNALDQTNSRKWHKYRKEIPLTGAVFLGIRIEAEGLDRTYVRYNVWSGNKSGHVDSTLTQNLLLHKLDIYLDGKHIDEYSWKERIHPVSIKESDIVPLSFTVDKEYGNIPELKTKRIIALGETVHGNETIAESAFQLIKYQVKNNGCKLVVLEKMAEEILIFNRFIQGDKSVHIDSILHKYVTHKGSLNTLLSINQLREFCLWLKEYNKTVDEKVWLMGMDYEFMTIFRRKALSEYLSGINRNLKSADIDEICLLLLKEPIDITEEVNNRISELWHIIRFVLYPYLGGQESEIVQRYIFEILETKELFNSKKTLQRDSVMAGNMGFYMDLLCKNGEKAIVYAHFLHTNYVDQFSGSSFGYYMRDHFDDDYFHIVMTTAQGTTSTLFSINPDTLQLPVENSIEFALNKMDANYFYIPVSKIKNSFMQIRCMGLVMKKNQFENGYISPEGRMGGIIFIRQSKAISFPEKH